MRRDGRAAKSFMAACVFIFVAVAETAFCSDASIGSIGQISDTWQLTSIDIGWGPVGGISVTVYAGAFAIPVNDVCDGNWSVPTTWSLSNLVVLYDRAKTWQDLLSGNTLVDVTPGSASFAWQ